MSTQQDQLPVGMPPLGLGNFTITLRLLSTDQGTVRLESESEISARFATALSNVIANIDPKDEAQIAQARAQAEALRGHEIALTREIAEDHAAEVQEFHFTFRAATTGDIRQAELSAAILPTAENQDTELLVDGMKASEVPVRLRSEFRRALSNRTLVDSTYPGFTAGGDFDALPNLVSDFVTSEVARRTYFSRDVRSFFPRSAAMPSPA